MIALIVQTAAMLANTPARPSENRSRGSPPPLHLCHKVQEMVITYKQANETETRDLMALKQTAEPELMHG
jgi:hypothetical protein